MNNFSSNIFPLYTLVFEKMGAKEAVCSRLGLNELKHALELTLNYNEHN
jgi:hypothetical protein